MGRHRILHIDIGQQLAARGMARPPRFFSAPTTRFNATLSPHRQITGTKIDLGRVKAVKTAYDVKLNAVPLLSQALDEPSAFESAAPGDDLNQHDARHVG